MPRGFYIAPHNAIINHNPNETLFFDPTGILTSGKYEAPNIAELIESAINNLLTQIDNVTGLDLLALATLLESFFGPGNNLLSQLWAFITGISGISLATLLADLGLADLPALVALLNTLTTDATNAVAWIENLLSGTGMADIAALASLISGLASAIGADMATLLADLGLANIAALVTFLEGLAPLTTLNNLLTALFGSTTIGAHILQAIIPSLTSGWAGTIAGNLIAGITTIEQNILDAIANALGHTGTGHILSDVQTWLGAIPQGNIAGLGAALTALLPVTSFQALLDAVANALGQAGLGHTVPNIQAYLAAIPQGNITGLTAALSALLSTATWQTLLDAIANAMGHSGTGHTVANIQTYLAAIPASVISGVTTVEQNILDAIANATGVAGTGHTAAQIETYLTQIPQINIIGLSSALTSMLSITTWQTLLDAIANALGHSGTGHTVANIQTYLGAIPNTVITAVLGGANLGADLQALVDNLSNALGHSGTGHTLPNILTYFGTAGIPLANVASQFGLTNIGSDVSSHINHSIDALLGLSTGTTTGGTPGSIYTVLGAMFSTVNQLSGIVQSMQTSQVGNANSGVTVNFNFANFAVGALPGANWTVNYSGSGTGVIGVASGIQGNSAQWTSYGNGLARAALIMENSDPTTTDYQLIQGTLISPPSNGCYFGVVFRANAATNPTTYGYAKVTQTGFLSYTAELGCYVAGVQHVFTTVAFPLSSTLKAVIGTTTNVRQFQIYSGTNKVIDYTDGAAVSSYGSGNRYWGAMANTDGTSTGKVSSGSCADNGPVTVVGSGAVITRHATGGVNTSNGAAVLPASTFDTQETITPNITIDLVNNKFTPTIAGWYECAIGYNLNLPTSGAAALAPVLYKNGNPYKYGQDNFRAIYNVSSANVSSRFAAMSCPVYCNGTTDYVQAGADSTSAMTGAITGEATGSQTYFSISMLNCSLN